MRHQTTPRKRPKPFSVQSAAIYALYITILLYLLFAIMLFYGRNAVIPADVEHHVPRPDKSRWMMLFGILNTYIYSFVLLVCNFRVLRSKRYGNNMKLAICILATILFAFIWHNWILHLQDALFEFRPRDPRAVRGGLVRDFILGGLVVFTSQIISLNFRRQQIAIEHEALKAEYERAKYETLKSQVDPHFLFNTLNTLNSIISTDPPRAQEYVRKLSSVFRYTMQNKETTTLAEELDFTRDYCALMQIRYGDNLRFEFDIAGKYNSYSLVPFSIQTLVENAIKHNVISNRQPLTVTIATDSDDTLSVSNPINPKKEPEPGGGIGLANLSERYRLKWQKEVVIRDDGGTFSVRIPLISLHGNTEKSIMS